MRQSNVFGWRLIPLMAFGILSGCVSAGTHQEQIARGDRLAAEKSALENEKAGLLNDKAALQAKVQELAGEGASLKQKLDTSQEKGSELAGKQEFTVNKLQDTTAQLEKAQKDIADLREKLAAELKKFSDLSGSNEYTKSKLQDSTRENEGMKKELEDLRGRFTAYQLTQERLAKDIRTLSFRFKESGDLLQDLTRQTDILNAAKSPEKFVESTQAPATTLAPAPEKPAEPPANKQ